MVIEAEWTEVPGLPLDVPGGDLGSGPSSTGGAGETKRQGSGEPGGPWEMQPKQLDIPDEGGVSHGLSFGFEHPHD